MHIVRRIVVSAIAIAVTVLSGCSSPTDGAGGTPPVITALPRVLSGDEQIAATATTDFGLALFKSVNARSARGQNLALSPISASLALGMLMNGAEGETLDQVRRTLGFGTRQVADANVAYKALMPLLTTLDPDVTMAFANAAWFDTATPASATFSRALSTTFNANVTSARLVDPATPAAINAWVSNATSTRIPRMVDRFDAADVAYLLNATYFKGKWRAQFDASKTQPADFSIAAGTVIRVPTMSALDGLVRMSRQNDGTMVGEMPFGGDAFVMSFVMPTLGTLESAIDSLTPARWRAMMASLPASTQKLSVQLPKFRIETSRELKNDLAALGMPRAFTNAQLTPMFASPLANLAVTSVLQRVFVDVNEEGAEAAAATGITIGVTSLPQGLYLDHPFLFVIRERLSGAILFIGKIVTPTAP